MLTPDMITEILCRLPPKSNIRFRSVSKSFCSEIDDPEFAKLHYNRSLKSGSRQVLTFNFGSVGFRLFDNLITTPPKPERVEHLTVPVVVSSWQSPIFASCRGLIALLRDEYVAIWNPCTSKHWIAPPSDIFSVSNILYPEAERVTIFGFGYDALSDDYKPVRIVRYVTNEGRMSYYAAGVYSFKSRHWRHISDPPNPLALTQGGRHSVFAHNSLHFVTVRPGILAFDLHTEQFRNLVELPSHGSRAKLADVTVLRGQLCSVFEFQSSDMEFWTIKDYGGKDESWNKLFRISVSSTWRNISVMLLDYLEGGNKILLQYNEFDGMCGFSWIELESRKVEEVEKGKNYRCFGDATVFVASMASLDTFRRYRTRKSIGNAT